MFVTTYGSALIGIEAKKIHIEVNWLLTGKSSSLVGLPDCAIRESLERIESVFKTNGYKFPRTKLVINLAPADIRSRRGFPGQHSGKWTGRPVYGTHFQGRSQRKVFVVRESRPRDPMPHAAENPLAMCRPATHPSVRAALLFSLFPAFSIPSFVDDAAPGCRRGPVRCGVPCDSS